MEDIRVEELNKRISEGEEINIIDVRETWEWDEYHIGGVNIPLGEIQAKVDDYDAWMDNELVVYCRSGARSAAAKDYLAKQGFKNVRNLIGGVLEWQEKIDGNSQA